MRPRRWVLRVCFVLAAVLPVPTLASAADLDHQLLVRDGADGLAADLNRAGAAGYRLSALVDRADDLAAIVSRPNRIARDQRFEYAVLSAGTLSTVGDLGRRGYGWRASATRLGWGGGIVVLERTVGNNAPRELQALAARDAGAVEGILAEPFAQGFRIAGRQRFGQEKGVWLVLERVPGAGARDVRAVSAGDRERLASALATAASQGYALETVWAHPMGLLRRDTLVAVLSRPRGSTAPAPHCAVETLSRSVTRSSDRLIAIDALDQGRDWLAAWCPGAVGGYWSRDIELEQQGGALFGATAQVEYELQRWNTGQIVSAFLLREHDEPSVLVALTLDAGMKLSEPEVASVKKLSVPKGGAPLPADGGDLLRIYLDMHRLYHAKKLDPAAVKPRWSAAVLADVAAKVKEMGWPIKERDMLEHHSQPFDGTDPRFRDGWMAGDRGLLRIDAVHDGLGSLIEIRFVREGGVWKIDDSSSWQRVAP